MFSDLWKGLGCFWEERGRGNDLWSFVSKSMWSRVCFGTCICGVEK